MEDDLIFWVNGRDIRDKLICLVNGRQPQLVSKWKTILIVGKEREVYFSDINRGFTVAGATLCIQKNP